MSTGSLSLLHAGIKGGTSHWLPRYDLCSFTRNTHDLGSTECPENGEKDSEGFYALTKHRKAPEKVFFSILFTEFVPLLSIFKILFLWNGSMWR